MGGKYLQRNIDTRHISATSPGHYAVVDGLAHRGTQVLRGSTVRACSTRALVEVALRVTRG